MEQVEKAALFTVGAKLMILHGKSPSADRRRQYLQILNEIIMVLVDNCAISYCNAINQMDAERGDWCQKPEDKP